MRRWFLIIFVLRIRVLTAQFAPAAGYPGTDAIPADSACFVNWANRCSVMRGYMNIRDTSLGFVSAGDDSFGTGKAMDNPMVSLGDKGVAILEFPVPLIDGPGPDFAVFENAFIDSFLELATVSVSSDGIQYYTFPSICHTDTGTQLGTFGLTDATKLYNLAGKYRAGFGVPFDLNQLQGKPGLDVNAVTHIKITDVAGILDPVLGSRDSDGHLINDPWPTPFPSGGFDLDAVGVIWDRQHSGIAISPDDVFNIFPNPTQGMVILEDPNPTAEIMLKNIQGQTLMKLGNGMNDLEHLPDGLYFMVKNQTCTKLVLQH